MTGTRRPRVAPKLKTKFPAVSTGFLKKIPGFFPAGHIYLQLKSTKTRDLTIVFAKNRYQTAAEHLIFLVTHCHRVEVKINRVAETREQKL